MDNDIVETWAPEPDTIPQTDHSQMEPSEPAIHGRGHGIRGNSRRGRNTRTAPITIAVDGHVDNDIVETQAPEPDAIAQADHSQERPRVPPNHGCGVHGNGRRGRNMRTVPMENTVAVDGHDPEPVAAVRPTRSRTKKK